MTVADFMTSTVVTVTPDTSILAAAKLMLEHRISGLPVVDTAGRLVGIVSEDDLLRRHGSEGGGDGLHWLQLMIDAASLGQEAARFREGKVGGVMTRDVVTVAYDAPLAQACRLIETYDIKRLPVIRDGSLVGIIARADLLRALARSVEEPGATAASDESVREQLVELERQKWRSRARSLKPL